MSGLGDDLVWIFLGSIALFVYIGWLHRTDDEEQYHTMGRSAGLIRTAASLFTVIGAPHFAVMTALAFFFGSWPIVFYVGSFLGFLTLRRFAPNIHQYRLSDAHTFVEVAALRLGRPAATALSTIALLFLLGVVVAQVILGALLLAGVSELSFVLAAVVVALGVAGYLAWGGYRALLYTDVIQGSMMFVLTLSLAWYLWSFVAIDPGVTLVSLPWDQFLLPLIPMLFLGGFVIELGAPQNWQRILTAKTPEVARRSLLLGGVLILTWGIVAVTVGNLISEASPNAQPQSAFVEVVITGLPYWMTGLVLVLLLVALMSTADSAMFAAIVVGQKEYLRLRNTPERRLSIRMSRFGLGVFTIVVVAASILLADIVDAWGVLVNLGLIMGPLAVCVLVGRGGQSLRTRQVTFGLAVGLSLAAFTLIWVLVGDFFTWWTIGLVAAAAFPLSLPGSRDSRKEARDVR